jgi:hypothetical protein
MPSIKFWSRSLSRVEFDQRSREARLQLERLERLLITLAAVRHPRLRWLLALLSAGEYGDGRQRSRDRRPLSDQRPCRIVDCPDSRCTI